MFCSVGALTLYRAQQVLSRFLAATEIPAKWLAGDRRL